MNRLSLGLAVMLLAGSVSQVEAGRQQLTLDVSPVNNVLEAGKKQSVWIRVGVQGFRLESEQKRPGVNLAIVLDKSGSMKGEKIARAREAAIDAIRLLQPNDIVSIITYDSTVNVLVPATKLTDKQTVIKAINGIKAGGNTALFAGVSKGAAEVRKFIEKERVNRVILLSDGLANVGPSSPGELGNLGRSLVEENISVSTLGLGLGYNEDLMVKLAKASGGNHLFIEEASELADIFRREFDDVLSVVAQEVDIKVTMPEGIRPVQVLGNEADVTGQHVATRIAQVYSEQDRHIVISVEVPDTETGEKLKLAQVTATYTNMKTGEQDRLTGMAKVSISDDAQKVKDSVNSAALADVVALVSSEQNKLATKYLDEGNLAACRQVLSDNVDFLKVNAMNCPTDKDRLESLALQNSFQLSQLKDVTSNKDEKANRARKSFRGYQNEVDLQQRVKSPTSTPQAP